MVILNDIKRFKEIQLGSKIKIIKVHGASKFREIIHELTQRTLTFDGLTNSRCIIIKVNDEYTQRICNKYSFGDCLIIWATEIEVIDTDERE
jgi:uncharacterized protein YbbC (DUF1343 family)